MHWTEKLSSPDKSDTEQSSSTVHIRRPASVTLLALGVLMLSAFNLTRLVTTIQGWRFWQEILPVSPMYLAFSGAAWMIAWAYLAWSLWKGQVWVGRFGLLIPLVYSLYYWIERWQLKENTENPNAPFLAGLNILFFILYAWILARPRVQAYLKQGQIWPGEKK